MNHGKLNKRVTYYKSGTSIADGYGGSTVTVGAAVTTWASAYPMTLSETLRFGMVEGTRPYKFVFHYEHGKHILRGAKMTYNTRTFKVNYVVNIEDKNDIVEVIATEEI